MCLGLPGTGMPQVEGGPRDREVLQAAAHEARDLVQPLARQHEIRLRFIEIEQLLLIFGEPEEVALLLHPFHRGPGGRAAHLVLADGGLALGVVGLVAHRVPAGIFRQVDVAGLLHALPDRRRGAVMARLGGAYEVVVGAVEPLHHGPEKLHVAIGELPRSEALAARGLQHLDAVLVGAGEEIDVVPVEPHEACDGVGRDRLVGVPDMRRPVRVGDRRRDVEAGLVCH